MNFKRTAALVATSTLLAAVAGCGQVGPNASGMMKKAAGTYNAAAKRRAEKSGTWNILIHMGAENNLYRFGLEDLNEMEAGLPADGSVNVYVLFDGIKDGDSCVYKVKRDTGMNSTIISEKVPVDFIPANNEIDSGSVKVASAFVQWAAKNAPADHTQIGYWDHGSGIFLGNPNPITKGIVWDDKGSNMTTADMGTVTNAFKAAAGKPVSILSFDACLMAHGEIAYQAAGAAEYMVASEELEPGKGWDYAGYLNTVGKLSSKTPAAVASALVDSYAASYASGGSQSSGRDAITLSAVDINAFNANVVPALNSFVSTATAKMGAEKANFQAARAKAQVFYNKDCADLGSFLSNLSATSRDGEVTRAAADLTAAYKSSIVRETHSRQYAGATGLVLYFPTPSQRYNAVYDDANKIGFARTDWKNFLKAYR